MPWIRDLSGRLQSQQKSEFRWTTDFKGELWYRRAGQTGQLLRDRSLNHSARCLCVPKTLSELMP
jgi:hypothetical protein